MIETGGQDSIISITSDKEPRYTYTGTAGAVADGVRCPRCNKKLAEALHGGLLRILCRRCKLIAIFDRRSEAGVS